jgi:hypothetical protein
MLDGKVAGRAGLVAPVSFLVARLIGGLTACAFAELSARKVRLRAGTGGMRPQARFLWVVTSSFEREADAAALGAEGSVLARSGHSSLPFKYHGTA